jgi:hypothetical protein
VLLSGSVGGVTAGVALQNGFTGPDLVQALIVGYGMIVARACADALPAHHPHLRVAGVVGAIFCCQGRRDIDLAS